jgi:rhodanese-related sulfurtransferase
MAISRSFKQSAAALAAASTLTACLAEATPTLDAVTALDQARSGEITLIDIRTPPEWRETGVAAGALTIDMTSQTFVQDILSAVQGDRDAPIVLICRTGNRTGYTQKALEKLGFTNVSHVAEGMAGSAAGPGWVRRGLPVEPCRVC